MFFSFAALGFAVPGAGEVESPGAGDLGAAKFGPGPTRGREAWDVAVAHFRRQIGNIACDRHGSGNDGVYIYIEFIVMFFKMG